MLDLKTDVTGLPAVVQVSPDDITIDLGIKVKTTKILGPRWVISRAADDAGRVGWRCLLHPDDSDPVLCMFIADGSSAVEVFDAQQKDTHWPGSV